MHAHENLDPLTPPSRQARRKFLKAGLLGSASALVSSLSSAADPVTVHEDLRAALGNAELSMLFNGKTPEECRAWQAKFRTTLTSLLGESTPPAKWSVEEESVFESSKFTRRELLLHADGIPPLPVYLFVPKGLKDDEKAPAVVAVHGHGAHGHHSVAGRDDLEGVAASIEKANYDYGRQFAERGYVVAVPCMIPFGRRVSQMSYGSDPCAVTFVRMQALGQLLMTANIRDLRWAISLLQSQPHVNGEAIGCAGLSYGGRMTMMVSTVDQRIKVASVSGALNLMQERMAGRYSCGAQVVPGLLKYGDYSEIGSLIAPRPCVWETGSRDGLIVPKWDVVFRNRLRRAYSALGAADRLHFDRFEGGHEWSGRIAFPLFDEVLKSKN
jgi:dienelactone hydrolase